MNTTNFKWNDPKIIAILAVLVFALGFVLGMQYKAYQIGKAFEEAFSSTDSEDDSESTTLLEAAEDEGLETIDKGLNETVVLGTIDLDITKVRYDDIINIVYGSPLVAAEGTKFVVVTMDVTNTTKSEFSFDPGLFLVDSTGREFSVYDNSYEIDDSIEYKDLSPGIKTSGSLVYQVPEDASGLSIYVAKAGTNELYKIKIGDIN